MLVTLFDECVGSILATLREPRRSTTGLRVRADGLGAARQVPAVAAAGTSLVRVALTGTAGSGLDRAASGYSR